MTWSFTMRRSLALAAVLALSLLALQSACSVLALQLPAQAGSSWLTHGDPGDAGHAGDALHMASHDAGVAAVAASAHGQPPAAAPTLAALVVPAPAPASGPAPDAPGPPLPGYYARSARILR